MTPDELPADMEAVVSEWLDMAQRVEPSTISTIRGVPVCQTEIDDLRDLLKAYQERGRALETRTPAPEGEASLWGCADGNGIDPRLVFRDRPTAEQVAADTNMVVQPLYAPPVVPVGSREESMTTPDIAGLCKRLRAVESSRHDGVTTNWYRNTDGPEAADALERQAAEIKRLREEMAGMETRLRRWEPRVSLDLSVASGRSFGAALTGEDTATLSLSGKTQTDARTRGDG
jgi:hypothetical protein